MVEIKGFNCLKISLDKTTKTLIIALDRPESKNALNFEILQELETILNWCVQHIEIHSILLTSTSNYFSVGLEREELIKMSQSKLIQYTDHIRKIIFGLLHLPQTVVIDLKKGARGMGLELSLGADIRFLDEDGVIEFDQLKRGHVPLSSGIGLLSLFVGLSVAKNWILTTDPIKSMDLKMKGFLHETYSTLSEDPLKVNCIKECLKNIHDQSPLSRIQVKMAFLDKILPEIERFFNSEQGILKASLLSEDFKKYKGEFEKSYFSSAKDFMDKIKIIKKKVLNDLFSISRH